MSWVAVVFFCFAENDCHFWYKETVSTNECSKAMTTAVKILAENKTPVIYSTCMQIKGKSI